MTVENIRELIAFIFALVVIYLMLRYTGVIK